MKVSFQLPKLNFSILVPSSTSKSAVRSTRRSLLTAFFFVAMVAHLPTAFAYHTDEHELITREAVQEINVCFPGLISEPLTALLVHSNLMEDFNIFNKEIWYSHYYNPLKNLKMRRYDSAYRINGLASDIAGLRSRAFDNPKLIRRLGHLIHHLQDATVPPHVVPVQHSTVDGFENFQIREPLNSGLDCRNIADARSTDYEMLLRDTAVSTLNAVDAIHWDVAVETKLISFPLFSLDSTAFWVPDARDGFGSYGYLGNAFGSSHFVKDGATYYVPSFFYRAFKQRQMSLAVITTARALIGALLAQPRALEVEPTGCDHESLSDEN